MKIIKRSLDTEELSIDWKTNYLTVKKREATCSTERGSKTKEG